MNQHKLYETLCLSFVKYPYSVLLPVQKITGGPIADNAHMFSQKIERTVHKNYAYTFRCVFLEKGTFYSTFRN